MTQRVHFQERAVEQLGDLLEADGHRSVFLVTGRSSYRSCGAERALDKALAGKQVTRFFDFEVNPKIADVERGLELFNAGQHDVIIGVGGGTVLDVAKLIAILAVQDAPVVDVIQQKRPITPRAVPLIALPTTSGTGSEATQFAVVYVDREKYSVADASMLPDHAIVDPCLTHSLPGPITAATGLDALCQAIESLWSVHSTDASKLFARRAIRLAFDNLRPAVCEPTAKIRHDMAHASLLAGQAINITRTTAPHALSYTMTSYHDVPHGHAVSLTLGPMLHYIGGTEPADTIDPRGPAYVQGVVEEINQLLGVASAEQGEARFTKLISDVGLATRLSDVGITSPPDRQRLIDKVNIERLKNNPRAMDSTAVSRLFARIA